MGLVLQDTVLCVGHVAALSNLMKGTALFPVEKLLAQHLMGSEESTSSQLALQVRQSQMQICQYGGVHFVTAASTDAVSGRHSALSGCAKLAMCQDHGTAQCQWTILDFNKSSSGVLALCTGHSLSGTLCS